MMTEDIRARLADPDTAIHATLAGFLRRRIEAAERHWNQRHDAWREAERLHRAYREPDQDDRRVARQKLTEGVQKIVVPYGYAQVQSMVAWFMTVLTERSPLVPVRADSPNDVYAAMLMEEVLQYQLDRMDPPWVLGLYQWLLDAHRYGVGVVKNLYTIREWPDMRRRFRQVMEPLTGMMLDVDEIVEEDVIAYEGNEVLNVSPFDFLPDPARSLGEFQRGEFVFHRMRRSRTELLQKQAQGLYTGVDSIPKDATRGEWGATAVGETASDLARINGMPTGNDDLDTDREPYVTIHEGWIFLEPRQLAKLGLTPEGMDSRTPRLWVFTMANRTRVLRAEPANLPGRRFPFEVFEANYDIHSPGNPGIIEMTKGLEYHLSWLFNSRMMAVRKTLNNELIVDPSMIEASDLEDPQPGKLLRLTRAAQNSGLIDKAVFPLPVQDVTANHHQDSRVVQEIMEQMTGAGRLLMGMPNTGRRAATEVQGMLNLSSGRMKMLAETFCAQGYRPLCHQWTRNTQVFMAESLNLRVKENLANIAGAEQLQILPQMLQGSFSFPLLEGGVPSDKLVTSQVLRELLQTGFQSGAAQPLLQQINWLELYAYFLRIMGIRNVGQFVQPAQMQVMPDEQVAAQAQQGNLVPAGEPQVSSDGFSQYPNQAAPMTGNNGY